MPLASMTGFSRSDGHGDDYSWSWELRSVNHRSLDLRLRLPQGQEGLEPIIRSALPNACKRGSVTAILTVTEESRGSAVRINEGVLESILQAMRQLEGRVDAAPPRLDGLLALRGVLEFVEPGAEIGNDAERKTLIESGFQQALAGLVAMRAEEGLRLATVMNAQLDEVDHLVTSAETIAASQPASIARRLERQLADLLDPGRGLSPDRLAQETALLATRADVREELDRLTSHIEAARALLAEGGAIGRRLDFLMQEFNREAITLCSKSSDLELTRLGLALKAAIEQLREQVQNIE